MKAEPRKGGLAARIIVLALLLLGIAGHASAGSADLTIVDTTAPSPLEVTVTPSQVDALDQQTMVTKTDYTDGEMTFTGPRMEDLLGLVGRGPWETARFVAANDYAVEIPVADFKKYGVILADSMNGKRLSLRDKGPYWVMYPFDQYEELRDPLYNNRLIWQVRKIELR